MANAAIMLATADSPIGIPAFGGPSRTRTRDDGSFTIDGIPNGNYRLSAALPIVTKTAGAGAGIGRGAIRGSFSSGGGGGALMTETANGVTTEYRFDPAGEVRIAIQDDHVTGVQLIATSLQ